MGLNLKWNRRGFLGTAAAIAAASIVAPRKLLASTGAVAGGTLAVSGFGQTGNPYDELGVTTVIQLRGHHDDAWGLAAASGTGSGDGDGRAPFRQHAGVGSGRGQADCRNAEAARGYTALVTSGAAAANSIRLAEILTGANEAFIRQIRI